MKPTLAFLLAACLFPLPTPSMAAGTLTFLRVRGEDIVNEHGEKVLLRGVGLGNWMLPEGYMWRFGSAGDRPRRIEKIVSDLTGPEYAERFWKEFRPQYITEADIQRIAQLGFNCVRPALNARLFMTEGEQASFCQEGFDLLEHLVGWCRAHGIYVIIDMHAAPGGQTGANIDDSADDQPRLFSDPKNQERLIQLWTKIAGQYKDESAVAAYDLLNEPLPERTGAAAKYKSQLEPLYQRITQAIRQVDKRHMISLEGADWANEWTVFTQPFDDNLFYQFHYYAWDRPDNLKGIRSFLEHRARLHRPIWAGETGEKDNAIYWGSLEQFEANNIGWSFWPWKKMETRNGPYSIKPPEGWDAVSAFSRGGPKPPADAARKTFDQLLQNIRLENCVYSPDVVSAIFRRVPGRLEAENYGHEGAGKSYSVLDASRKARVYRTAEPVAIVPLESNAGRFRSEQAIQLRAGEWTAYTINSLEPKSYEAAVKARAAQSGSAFEITSGRSTQTVSVDQTNWTELKLAAIPFSRGANRLKVAVKSGTVEFDWFEFK